MKEALALDDISADIASDGKSGLKKFISNNYDLILLDLKMPGLSGDEVLSEIRKQDPFIDVIIYTNYTDFGDIKKLTNIGIEGYINKGPKADLSELISAIKEKLAPLDDETSLIQRNKLHKGCSGKLWIKSFCWTQMPFTIC